MHKKCLAVILILFVLASCFGCSKMPYNGEIAFHSISLTVPERFVRDSTQSTDDLWVFERNRYSEYVLVSRSDMTEEGASALASYVERMKETGAESRMVSFLGGDAVLSTYDLNGVFCQEILFPHDNSFYAVALRGGNESGFEEITKTIQLR